MVLTLSSATGSNASHCTKPYNQHVIGEQITTIFYSNMSCSVTGERVAGMNVDPATLSYQLDALTIQLQVLLVS